MNQVTGHGSVLFVCRKNLCRSPMAMALLRHRFQYLNCDSKPVSVDSAGYYDWAPFFREAHPFARRAVEGVCGDDLLVDHREKQWTLELVRNADLIIVAEEWMCADFPCGCVTTMRELGGQTGDVEDPYGKDYDAYVACAGEIDNLIVCGMPYLLKRLRVDCSDPAS